MSKASVLNLFAAALALSGAIGACTTRAIEDPLAPVTPPPPPPVEPASASGIAVVSYAYLDLDDAAVQAEVARAELLVNEMTYLWSPSRNQGAVAALKARNPELKVLGYVNAQTSWLMWGDDPAVQDVNPYGWDWYHATRPYWSTTTTGDTMMAWPGKVVLNILDPACREAMIDVLADHWQAHSNVVDGVYWDHFNTNLWVMDSVPGREGALDLDGDGTAHLDDEDEQQAYRDASTALVLELRARLGGHVIQVTNGNRAALDSTFAGLVDGMLYENFPQVGFWGDNMRQALDRSAWNSLFASRHWPRTDNGGPFVILSNKDRITINTGQGSRTYRYADFARPAALLTGTLVSYHSPAQEMDYGWPDVELDLGAPLGEAQGDGGLLVRNFENGTVTVNMTSGDLPIPFHFSITESRGIVQSFQFPSIFP
ncbi:MAG: hypothetical protein IPK64_14280 [bacterium]|nr:hypothetical protein [bacterium]